MIDKKFSGIQINPTDTYGMIHLKLAIDLLASTRRCFNEKTLKEKSLNIAQVCCEQMFDNLIEAYDWNPDEANYAEAILVTSMNTAAEEILQIAQRKRKGQTRLCVTDFKLATLMSYVMSLPCQVWDQIENTFLEEHGAMNFSR